MREIKFRGYSTEQSKWLYGYYCFDKQSNTHFIFTDDIEIGYEVDGKSVSEFTGLKDGAAKEIYEGDILEFTDKWEWYRGQWFAKFAFASKEEKIKLQKEYDALPMHRREVEIGYEGVNFSIYDLGEKRWKVIGNIYQNPELLNNLSPTRGIKTE